MRGEEPTLQNLGKTVTDNFEKVANNVNDYLKSDKPRTFLQKMGDFFVATVGFILKVGLVIVALIFSPVLLVMAIVFVALLFAAVSVAIGGGAALISLFPAFDWTLPAAPLTAIVMYIAGILAAGIPLVSLVYLIFQQVFSWKPMVTGLKWTLFALWIVSLIIFCATFTMEGFHLPELFMTTCGF